MKKIILNVLAFLISFQMVHSQELITVLSPDNNYKVEFSLKDPENRKGIPFYNVQFKGKPVILESAMGLSINGRYWKENFVIKSVESVTKDTSWIPVYGEKNLYRDHYNQTIVRLGKKDNPDREMDLIIRAYNEGIAFKYSFPLSDNGKSILDITSDDTEFSMADSTKAYFCKRAQASYEYLPLANWTDESDRPLVLTLKNGLYACLAEAQMTDFARTKFTLHKTKPNTIVCAMSGPATFYLPFSTPWRVVMAAEKPADLIMNNSIILNLNPPCAIANTDWIKPGKVMRETSLSTAGAKALTDFAVKHNLQYMLFDAGWYGKEFLMESNASKVDTAKKLDLKEVIQYAKQNNVGVILYVNQRALAYQIDQILPLYRSWGVSGMKYGFVYVGSQEYSTWLHEAVKKAADNQLMVDIHDEYRPTGFSRTYSNLMTQEGIRGNEEFPDATHNVTLPFTRYIAGAADYTICYYDKRLKTTHAHQLAMAAVYYSPWQLLFWYDRPAFYQGEPEIGFFENVKTVWDETRVLNGEIGQYITTARRSGDDWFLGCMTNDSSRTVSFPVNFLDNTKKYTASVYTDDDQINTRTKVKVEKFIIDSRQIMKFDLKASGGAAVMFKPASEQELKTLKKYKAKNEG